MVHNLLPLSEQSAQILLGESNHKLIDLQLSFTSSDPPISLI